MTLTGTFTEYPIPTPGSGPESITVGADGYLWFNEQLGNKVAKISP
jgi:virginiamycin B lyase